MQPLSSRLESLNFSSQLVELKNIVETCEPSYTFWGSRVIKAKGMSGSYNLNLLYDKVYVHACNLAKIGDLSINERIAGMDIVKKMNDFHQKTDEQLNKANFLTRFFHSIREFSFSLSLSSPQSLKLDTCFRAFKKEKFKELFKEDPIEWDPSHKLERNCQGTYRDLFFASEDAVRKLASS